MMNTNTPRAPRDDTSHLKQERAMRTRGVILDSAAAAFAEDGFPNVTIKQIADRAEMTKGAVYFHFANKEALAVTVTEHFYTRLGDVVNPTLEAAVATPDTVKEVFLRVAKAFRDDPYVQAGARLQIERPYIRADLPTPYEEFTYRVAEILRKCRNAGSLRESADPDVLARVLRSALFGAQHISWVTKDRSDIVERVQEITDSVLAAQS